MGQDGRSKATDLPDGASVFWRQQGEARDRLEASRDIRVWGQVILPVWPAHARRDWQVKIFARPFGGAGAGRGSCDRLSVHVVDGRGRTASLIGFGGGIWSPLAGSNYGTAAKLSAFRRHAAPALSAQPVLA